MTPAGQRALAAVVFAAGLRITGALPLAVTALTIPAWLVTLGVYPTLAEALTGFADPVVFLLLSTFVLAAALWKHDSTGGWRWRSSAGSGRRPAGLSSA